MGIFLCVICHFSLVAFNILSLSLIFVSLVTMCLGVFLLGFILPGPLASWTWQTTSFPMFGKFSAIISSNIFSGPFSLSSPSGTPIMRMFVHLFFYFFLTFILFIYFLFFYFIFKLYIILLVLPNIKMNPPQVYMCSPS